MKTNTNPLKSLFGLATVATALSGTAFSQGNPQQGGRLSIQVVDDASAQMKEAREASRRAAAVAMPQWHRSMVDQAIDRAMADMKDGKRQVEFNAVEPGQWRIGLEVVPVESILRVHLNLPEGAGVLVSKVMDAGPAAKAGITENDIIVSAGDRKIDSLETLKDVVHLAGKSDGPLVLAVIHNGKPRSVKIMKMPPPVAPSADLKGSDPRPFAEMGTMMREQNRRFEEMKGAMKEMRQQLEEQQRQIKELGKMLRERNAPREDPRRRQDVPAERNDNGQPKASE